MPTETGRIIQRKRIALPGGGTVDVPVITQIKFLDVVDQGQESEFTVTNTGDAKRDVRTASLPGDDAVPDETGGSSNDTSQLQVERIDTWRVRDVVAQGQETFFAPDNKTFDPSAFPDFKTPYFTTHEKTHVVKYINTPDDGNWIESELIDKWKYRDLVDQAQETEFFLSNPPDNQNITGITVGTDSDGITTTIAVDPSLPDISDSQNGVDPPWRLDPWQNLVKTSVSGSFLLGGAGNFTVNSSDAIVSYPSANETVWTNKVVVKPGANTPIRGLAYGNGYWIALSTTYSYGGIRQGTEFYKSTDNGKTWYLVYTSNLAFAAAGSNDPDAIVFIDGTFLAISTYNTFTGATGGTGAYIITNTDATGEHWVVSKSPLDSSKAAVTSLSIAGKKIFIGVQDYSGNAIGYFHVSSDAGKTWQRSSNAFTGMTGQDGSPWGLPDAPVTDVIPHEVAFSEDLGVYASVCEYDVNNYEWLATCSSPDGLSWGLGKQYGTFTLYNPNASFCPVTNIGYWPSFLENRITWGRTNPDDPNDKSGVFLAVAYVTSMVNTCGVTDTAPGGIGNKVYQYPLDWVQHDIGVMRSVDGSSWTFQKIEDGASFLVPGGSYDDPAIHSGGDPYDTIIVASATAIPGGAESTTTHMVKWSPTLKEFLFVSKNIDNWAIHNVTYPPAGTQYETGNYAQHYYTSKDGSTWRRVATIQGPSFQNPGAAPVTPDPNATVIGLGRTPKQ
jgi:hypothetical protein